MPFTEIILAWSFNGIKPARNGDLHLVVLSAYGDMNCMKGVRY